MEWPPLREEIILFIIPSDIDDLRMKGVLSSICTRSEKGFFHKVLTLHPLARKSLKEEICINHSVVQFGWQELKYKPLGILWTLLRIVTFPFQLESKPSIIRATDPYLMGLIAWYYSKVLGVPFVVSIHADYDKRYELDGNKGSFVLFGSRTLAKKLERFIFSRANLILPIRVSMVKSITDGSPSLEKKVCVIPHGVDFKTLDEKSANISLPDLEEDNRAIISFADLVEIITLLDRDRKDFVLVIAGGGNEEEGLKQAVKDRGLDGVIRFLGFLPNEATYRLRQLSQVSLCLMGGFSLIEAAGAGSPVLAYDVEWHYELVKDNETGFLIEEKNIKEAARRLQFLLDRPDEAKRMGQNAALLARQMHDFETTRQIKIQAYKKAMA